MEKKTIVYVDLDDTVCHYKKAWKLHKRQYPEIEFPQSVEGFFLKLKPIKDAVPTILRLTKRFSIRFATRPSYKNVLCYTEKRIWVEKHFGLDLCEHLNFASDKGEFKRGYLIDDIEWKEFPGTQIQFGTNDAKTWLQVEKLLNKFEDKRLLEIEKRIV